MIRRPARSTRLPYATLCRSSVVRGVIPSRAFALFPPPSLPPLPPPPSLSLSLPASPPPALPPPPGPGDYRAGGGGQAEGHEEAKGAPSGSCTGDKDTHMLHTHIYTYTCYTHTLHTHIYTHKVIYVCVCVCVSACSSVDHLQSGAVLWSLPGPHSHRGDHWYVTQTHTLLHTSHTTAFQC